MARLSPSAEILRALFARSGNQCAFPGCTHELINSNNKFVAQVCHIEAANEGGERFNPTSTDEQRRSYNNLLILCYAHHVETDDVSRYSVDILREMKLKHEELFEKSNFRIDETELYKITLEMEEYWNRIYKLNKLEHQFKGTGVEYFIDENSSLLDVFHKLEKTITGIENLLKVLEKSDEQLLSDIKNFLEQNGFQTKFLDEIPYYENPFYDRNWETHNMGRTNWLQDCRITLEHLKIKVLEQYIKLNKDDLVAKQAFNDSKRELENFAKEAIIVD